ncbi:MAG TPA: flagellar biosynthetic protein FliQ [Pirellulaceae bacterium]|nr:flagellar biosynthetic protein FliQ [Pirellulaceae bacterium]HMO92634.1 flagellar biosynthetic protein FliQ [Pirellulaceae bacterium]HMP70218.1 flagellar biosynthetic protein FliQ [Pirellulaceae bacterium]
MNSATQNILDLSQQALQSAFVIALPVLATALLVGFVVSTLQAMTHIHDQSIGTIMKLLAVFVLLLIAMPWLVDMMLDYSASTFRMGLQTTSTNMP